MSYLFYIDEKNSLLLRPECYKLCPELSALEEKDILFISLAYDYHSVYRQFPEHERVRKAMFHAYDKYDTEFLNRTSIKIGIEAYKSLQYDRKIEFADRLQKKIDSILDLIDEDDNDAATSKRLKTLDDLRRTIKGLENEITESIINKGQVKGDQDLSWIEELQSNRKYYLSLKKEHA